MAVVNIVKDIKGLLPDYVVLIKIGTFFETYNEDANIMSYLFGYKIRNLNDTDNCGFPIGALNKVLSE